MTTVFLPLGYRSMARSPQVTNDLDALLRRVAAGDADAFAEFYDATRARVRPLFGPKPKNFFA
jgi:RNA polymerase sigma-70 factor (ECF subfamily)